MEAGKPKTRQDKDVFQPNSKLLRETMSVIHRFHLIPTGNSDEKSDKSAQSELVYSPEPRDPDHVVYYAEIHPEFFESLFSHIPSNSPVYISVFLLRNLSEGYDEDWMLEEDEEDSDQKVDDKARFEDDLAWLQSDDKWEEYGEQHSLEIPLRDRKGSTLQATLRSDGKTGAKRGATQLFQRPIINRKKWKKWIIKKFNIPASSWSNARHSNFPLTHPLLIWPVQEAFVKNPLQDYDYEILRICVDDVNDERDLNPEWKLELPKVDPGLHNEYKLMSIDPFGMFFTFIHLTDWSRWMAAVGLDDAISIRPFISEETVEMSTILTRLSDNATQAFNNLNAKEKAIRTKRIKEIPGIEMKDKQAKYFAAGRYRETHEPTTNSIQYTENGVAMKVHIDADKIKKARGKRKTQKTQEQVMCGIGAPALAASFGWSKNVYSSLTNAEWLHLVGFAYGGFLEAGAKNSWETSQIPYNLVFGTSETNSLMTRYETAWQEFMTRESKLRALLYASELEHLSQGIVAAPFEPPKGTLRIQTNNPHTDLEYDVYNSEAPAGKKYSTWEYDRSKKDSLGPIIEQGLGEDVSIDTIDDITKSFFFIANTIDYELVLHDESYVLGAAGFWGKAKFSPFQRPLLHSAEVFLDRKIMSYLYLFARQRLALHRVDLKGTHEVDFDKPDIGEKDLATYKREAKMREARRRPGSRVQHKDQEKTRAQQKREAGDEDGDDVGNSEANDADTIIDRDDLNDLSEFEKITKRAMNKK
ncbi:hypothetical protein AK830_g2095 [Neonectria ditissima]|uniref:Uncharacterized protein n=1 Tax=Neonectria ditissima TaxID=78410 RepID=A0A0P7BGL0_9HYPO|nr:hypothetical protein AK830_g2095 [Neonectria ditissima]